MTPEQHRLAFARAARIPGLQRALDEADFAIERYLARLGEIGGRSDE